MTDYWGEYPWSILSFPLFLINNENPPITFKPTDINELQDICKAFKPGKALGIDDIPMHVIKNLLDFVSEPLVKLIDLSLFTVIFLDELKITKIIPTYKSGCSDSFTNYGPISLLTSFSKFFEKVMYNRLIDFIDRYEILYFYQFGFGKKHSTSMGQTHLVNKITSAIDRNEVTTDVCLDLSKAFDTLDHEILFAKLEHYVICGLALKWIESHFLNRRQITQFKETCSYKILGNIHR